MENQSNNNPFFCNIACFMEVIPNITISSKYLFSHLPIVLYIVQKKNELVTLLSPPDYLFSNHRRNWTIPNELNDNFAHIF
jgi:hypothetical protein